MKFNKFLEKMPNFWAFSQIPAAVQEQVNNWFYYRDCCSNNVEKFNRFLSRKVNLVEPQFMAMWKAQGNIEFEPGTIEKIESTIDFSKEDAVVEAIQRIVTGSVADTGTTKNEQTVSATDMSTETRNLTNVEKMTGTESREEDKTQTNNTVSATTKTGTEKTDTDRTRTDDLTVQVNDSKDENGTITNGGTTSRDSDVKRSDYPQSTPLGFENYISAEEKSEVTDTDTHTETRDLTSTGSSTTKNTGTQGTVEETTLTHNTEDETKNTGTIKNDGTDVLTIDRENNTTNGGTLSNEAEHEGTNNTTLTLDTKQESNSNDKTDRTNDIETKAKTVIETLRSGNFEEAFEKYFRMAATFNSVSWLIGQLDVCFIQIFDFCEEDEEDDNGGGGGDMSELQAQIDALKAVVTKNTADISGINTSVTNLNNEVNSLQDVQETLTDDMATTKSDLSAFESTTNSKFNVIAAGLNSVEKNVSDLSGQVQTIDNDLAVLDSKVTMQGNSITNVQDHVNTVDGEVSTLTGRVSTLETEINSVNDSIATIDGKVLTIETDVQTMQTDISDIDSRLTANENTDAQQSLDINDLESRVSVLEDNQGGGSGVIKGVATMTDIKAHYLDENGKDAYASGEDFTFDYCITPSDGFNIIEINLPFWFKTRVNANIVPDYSAGEITMRCSDLAEYFANIPRTQGYSGYITYIVPTADNAGESEMRTGTIYAGRNDYSDNYNDVVFRIYKSGTLDISPAGLFTNAKSTITLLPKGV